MAKKSKRLYPRILNVNKKPKNSLKTGETKHFRFYVLGNKYYSVLKKKFRKKK